MAYNQAVLELLKRHFGYDGFRPLQEEVIATLLAGKDALVLMPTGGGKSLCYQLPALKLEGLTLVVSPLIALMKDQVDSLQASGIPAGFANSTLTPAELRRVEREAQEGRIKLLYVAPERLATPGFRRFLRSLKLSLVAIDEAHCISEWGHEFRPDYRTLNSIREQFPSTPMVALTATATQRVRQDVRVQLALRDPKVFVASFNRPNLTYTVLPKTHQYSRLTEYIARHRGRPVIIYRISRQDTEDLAHRLTRDGMPAEAYHAGLDDRDAIQERFINDEVPIIVATVAFGMGINKPDVRMVVHYDLPGSVEQYYQETGRAGRDGLPADCVLFYSFADRVRQKYFIDFMDNETEREGARRRLDAMIAYGDLVTCRRRYLLQYFHEDSADGDCGNCDICLSGDEARTDATIISQKILSAVIRTGGRFGAAHVAKVLRGADTKQVRQHQHHELSVYGIVDDLSEPQIRETMNLLLRDGYLEQVGEYRALAVTVRGRDALKGRENFFLPPLTKETQPGRLGAKTGDLQYDSTLFEKLRALRRNIASDRGVPPYVIFGDAVLQQMAYYFPQTDDTLFQISGVGEVKLKQYGPAFLTSIRDYCRLHGFPDRLRQSVGLGPVADASSGKTRRGSPGKGKTLERTKLLLQQGKTLSEIAVQRGLSKATVVGHIERLIMDGEPLEFKGVLPSQQRMTVINRSFAEHGSGLLAPVRESLGEEYTYEELRLVRAYLIATEKLTESRTSECPITE